MNISTVVVGIAMNSGADCMNHNRMLFLSNW